MSINKDEVRFHCFGACKGDWDICDLIMLRKKCRFETAQQVWADHLGVEGFKPFAGDSSRISEPDETSEPDDTPVFVEPKKIDEKIAAAFDEAAGFYNDLLMSNEDRFKNLFPAQTLDGVSIPLHANLGIGDEDLSMLAKEYEGVGLYRTEFSFIAREELPTEDDQYRLYRDLLESFAPQSVTIRTLDAGGDKKLPFFTIAETNSFLGRRGIRFTLDNPDIFLTQLRALLRANAGLGNLRVLFPMIGRVGEIDAALDLLDRACLDLAAEGRAFARPRIGAMIEVASTVFLIAKLSKRVDFFSIGTNDLTQYLMAVERSNPQAEGLNDNLHPAVVHVVNDIVQRSRRHNKPVGVCGEMAGEPPSALLKLGLGVDSPSMNPSSLPRVNWIIRSFAMKQGRELAEKALNIENEFDTLRLLNHALKAAGIGALAREN